MDPTTALLATLQSGAQLTPAQIQQLQQMQLQQQHNSNVTPTSGNQDTAIGQQANNIPNGNNQMTNNDGNISFQETAPTTDTQHVNSVQNGNGNANAANNAFQKALAVAAPWQQQLAVLSGYPQNSMSQVNTDGISTQSQQQPVANVAFQPQQQVQAWNPQLLQQFMGMNPFVAAPGVVVPTPMNVQQLQQQFMAQQMLSQQLAAGQNNAAGGFNQLLAALLTQNGGVMNAATGFPNQMMQPTIMPGFPFATVPAQQQHIAPPNAMMNAPALKTSNISDDSQKGSGEVEWTKPFAAKVKKESPFPLKLYQILGNPECQEYICWNPHGRSWRILKPPVFEQVVIPLYFRHAKYASFMRQVNGWGFKRVVTGSDHNSYYHELFIRDNPQLCLQMKRIKRKDVDGDKLQKDEDGSDNEFGPPEDNTASGNENYAVEGTATPAADQPPTTTFTAPTSSDYLKLAGLTGYNNVLPTGMNNITQVAQPNFMMNGMLPAAFLGNPNLALPNTATPLTFPIAGLTSIPGTTTIPNFTANVQNQGTVQAPAFDPSTALFQQQFNPSQTQTTNTSTVPAPTGINLPSSETNTGSVVNTGNNNTDKPNPVDTTSLMNAISGMDSATITKLQQIVAAGGAETLLQHLQQQLNSGSSGGSDGSAPTTNDTTNVPAATSTTTSDVVTTTSLVQPEVDNHVGVVHEENTDSKNDNVIDDHRDVDDVDDEDEDDLDDDDDDDTSSDDDDMYMD